MSDRRKIYLNTYIPLLAQLITMICGFILPRAILIGFGSEINGASSSVAQFLGVINFFDLGVTAVFQSALYKPLSNKNKKQLSETVAAADRFFGNIGKILVLYIVAICFIVPFVSDGSFSFFFWATLILAMGINSFGQYYLGVVDRIILIADQKYYLTSIVQVIAIILNTIISVKMINSGASVQLVRFVSSLIFLARPLFYRFYVRRNYEIDRKIKYVGEPLKQKWNGMAQHICAVVLDGTDIIVLNVLSSLFNVSIYQMYYLVVAAVKTVFLSMTNAISPYMGKLWAQDNKEEVKRIYGYYEWTINAVSTFVFGCTASLIVPFIMLYTREVTDADYYQPIFSLLLTISVAFYCMRLPYTSMINATGSYKETQHIYIIATILNITISVATVKVFGLIGVTIGTVVSLGYQTVHLSLYCSRKLLNNNLKETYSLWITDIALFSIGYILTKFIDFNPTSYGYWFIYACFIALMWGVLSLVIWLLVQRQYTLKLGKSLLYRFKK